MKRWLFWSLLSVATFITGTFLVYSYRTLTAPVFTADGEVAAPEPSICSKTQSEGDKYVAEFADLQDFEILDFPDLPENFIDLHNTDGLLRSSEVVGKNGQKWQVMSELNGKYTIKTATATVRQLKSVSYPGDENDAKITFGLNGRPVFAFRKIRNIRSGPVTTVYLRPTMDEIDRRNLPIEEMETGYKRDLNLNENWYTLRVTTGATKGGGKVGILVLKNSGIEKVIARNSYPIIGDLLWAGDLDNDGKLDLYFDEFNEKGYFSGGLYLSSHAADGELVKLAARFSYAGC